MPNRVIRESLLDSERFISVEPEARLLYVSLLLLADDFGCVSIAPGFIGRRCFSERPNEQRLSELLGQLAKSDLIRTYGENGRPEGGPAYAFIPRFGQRLKRETLKHPIPPSELIEDDDDAKEKFKQLNGHAQKGAAVRRERGNGVTPEGGNPDIEVKRSEVKRSEEKGSEGKGREGEGKGNLEQASARDPVAMARALAERQTRLSKN